MSLLSGGFVGSVEVGAEAGFVRSTTTLGGDLAVVGEGWSFFSAGIVSGSSMGTARIIAGAGEVGLISAGWALVGKAGDKGSEETLGVDPGR